MTQCSGTPRLQESWNGEGGSVAHVEMFGLRYMNLRCLVSCASLIVEGKGFVPQTGLPVWGSYSFQRVASLGRMILPLSPGLHPTLGALGRMSLHLSPPCLPLCVPWAA